VHGIQVLTGHRVNRISRAGNGLRIEGAGPGGTMLIRDADLVLVVTGVRPDTALAGTAGVRLGIKDRRPPL
jgi:NADPH-dependent 2,4-dienoyl-CoA reductase/sulfur reductase-like enzyme